MSTQSTVITMKRIPQEIHILFLLSAPSVKDFLRLSAINRSWRALLSPRLCADFICNLAKRRGTFSLELLFYTGHTALPPILCATASDKDPSRGTVFWEKALTIIFESNHPDAEDYRAQRLLQRAVISGRLLLVKLLRRFHVEYFTAHEDETLDEAEAEEQNWNSYNPVNDAVCSKSIDMLQYVLEENMALGPSNTFLASTYTPLAFLGLNNMDKQIALYLLDKGYRAGGIRYIYWSMVKQGDLDILQAFMEAHPTDTMSYDVLGDMAAATVTAGNVEAIKILLDAGVGRENGEPHYLLMGVCKTASNPTEPKVREILNLIFSRGADVNGKNPAAYHCSLSLAAQYGTYEMVQYLLDYGADPDNCTPLWKASYNDDSIRVIDLLLERGADLKKLNLEQVVARNWTKGKEDRVRDSVMHFLDLGVAPGVLDVAIERCKQNLPEFPEILSRLESLK